MIDYVFVLVAISLVLLPFKKISLHNRVDQSLLALMAFCYAGLTALFFNVERTVALGDRYPSRTITPWFGGDWMYVAVLAVGVIAVLHIIIFATRRHTIKFLGSV